jgi:hypothetical protein
VTLVAVVLYALGLTTARLAFRALRGDSRLIWLAVPLWPVWVVWESAKEVGQWVAEHRAKTTTGGQGDGE